MNQAMQRALSQSGRFQELRMLGFDVCMENDAKGTIVNKMDEW